jgi:hypothetical protein
VSSASREAPSVCPRAREREGGKESEGIAHPANRVDFSFKPSAIVNLRGKYWRDVRDVRDGGSGGPEWLKIERNCEPARKCGFGRGAVRNAHKLYHPPIPPIVPANIYDGGGFE